MQDGETDKITPVEAEERAGLKNNKNWKKSLFTSHQVCGNHGLLSHLEWLPVSPSGMQIFSQVVLPQLYPCW